MARNGGANGDRTMDTKETVRRTTEGGQGSGRRWPARQMLRRPRGGWGGEQWKVDEAAEEGEWWTTRQMLRRLRGGQGGEQWKADGEDTA